MGLSFLLLESLVENAHQPSTLDLRVDSQTTLNQIVFSHNSLVYYVQAVQRNGASSMEMRARVCDLLGKEANRKARVVTFSHKRIHKVQQVNLQWKKFYSDELGRKVRLRLSTKGIKTVNKYGSIDAAAKKFNLDLNKF